MNKSRLAGILAAVLAVTLLLSGCSSGGTSQDQNKPTPFVYAIEMDPGSNVNVITTADRIGLMEIKAVYSPLYTYSANGTTWYLATELNASENGKVYTAKLRQDVTWSDGQPFTADDVVFTYQKMLDTPDGWANEQLTFGDEQVKVEKVDDYTVSFTFPTENPVGPELLANVFIMPQHLYAGEADIENSPNNVNPVGTGPYTLSEYRPGEYLQFTAREDYFGGTAKNETMIFRVVTDSAAGRLALQKGEVNAITAQATDMEELKNAKGITAYPYSEGRVAYMVFNTTAPAVENSNVRKAIMYALNREEINTAAFISQDYAQPVYTFLPANNPYSNPDAVEKYEQDTARAKELLTAEGVQGLKLKLAYVGTNVPQQRQAAVIQQQLKAIGVEVELYGMDPSALDQEMQSDHSKYELFLGGYIIGVDPSMYADMFLSDSVYNYSHYADSQLDAMFQKAALETDQNERYALYTAIQQHIQENATFYPFADNKRILVTTENVAGVEDSGLVPIFTIEDFSKLYFK